MGANGRFSGKGRQTWKKFSGSASYVGQFKDGMKHGVGQICVNTEQTSWETGYWEDVPRQRVGYWVNDKFSHWESNPMHHVHSSAGSSFPLNRMGSGIGSSSPLHHLRNSKSFITTGKKK